MCWTASRPRVPLADWVAQLAMRTAKTIRTAAGRAARSGTPPCILRKLGATSAGKSRPMFFDGAVGKDAEQFLDGGGSREQPLVRVLGHAVGGAPSALVHLVEGRLPGDQPQILLVGHPEVRHHHPSLVTAEAAVGAPRPPVEGEARRRRFEELVQRGRRRRVLLAARQTDPTHQPLRYDPDEGRGDKRRLDLQVEEARQGGDGAVGVQRAEEEVARLGGAEGDLGRLLVADLPHHDDLRVMTEEGAEIGREGVADVLVDLGLAQFLVHVLHRVLRGEDADLRSVELHQARVERGGLAGTGGAGYEEDAGGTLDQLLESTRHHGGQIEGGDGARSASLIEDADDHALSGVAGDDGDAQVDSDLGPPAIDGDLEAPVLWPAPLRDVELAQDADPGGDLSHVLVEVVLERAEVRLAEHAVDAVAHMESGRQHLQMDIAAVLLEGAEEDLTEQLVRPPGRPLVPLGRRRRARLRRRVHRADDEVGAEGLRGLGHRVLVESAEGALNGTARGGDHGDAEAREPHQLVDDRRRGGIVHGHGEGAANLGDGEERMPARVALVDHASEATVEGDLLQVDVWDGELLAEGLPHRLVGDVVELEEDLAQRHLEARLLRESVLELGLGNGAELEEDLAETATSGRGGGRRRAGGAGGYLSGGHSRSPPINGRLVGARRTPTGAASTWCIPRRAR